eukprot:1136131-Pelagomonas_calceolata.AAC.2
MSELSDLLLAAMDQPQADQPNSLAEENGQPAGLSLSTSAMDWRVCRSPNHPTGATARED